MSCKAKSIISGKVNKAIYLLPLTCLLLACGGPSADNKAKQATEANKVESLSNDKYVKDVHSFADPEKVAVSHISLDMDVDFEQKMIDGIASHTLIRNGESTEAIFDINDLLIDKVTLDGAAETKYEIKKGNEFGDALHVSIEKETKTVNIHYKTMPGSKAVQWLDPVQTSGKRHPFLFTQGQAILTRTWIPCQDSPGIRVTYDAKVKVPRDLMAVMSASNPTEKSMDGAYSFKMEQAIPPYLIALAIGDLEFRKLGPSTGVYAEPDMIEKGAYELEDMQKMVSAAEGLYGAYRWDQYDVIFLPPSFPFGGMENPRLTFATPTILAGDKSLTSLIAHELAHSWSGNLVTNATWDDFWLNEGFTVYFEYRIMEEVYGKDYTNMIKSIGAQDLKETVKHIGHSHADTHLKLDLEGRDPDEGMTDIAYEKGHMFLEMLENTYGRKDFDAFLKGYFNRFAFKNMTTDRFLAYLDAELISKHDKEVNIDEWVFGPGLPDNCPKIVSDRFAKVDDVMSQWRAGKLATSEFNSDKWSTHEWLRFIRGIPSDLGLEKMAELDKAFGFSESKNSEILGVWFIKAVENEYEDAFPAMEEFLVNVGRRKFLTPIYTALIKDGKFVDVANAIYDKARPNYHSVSTGTMDKLLRN